VNRLEYIADGRHTVPGWFFEADAILFDTIDTAQRQAGISGDILEIGCYQGASAILLGYMAKHDERFIVCDIFDGAPVGSESDAERQRFYMDLSRQSFETNYLRFHNDLPHVVAGPSSTLVDHSLGRTFRFIHVDGSHAYDIVRSDLDLASQLLAPGGVVVFDDIVSMHAPGVTAAVWEGVLRNALVPMFQSRKFYGTWGAPLPVEIPPELPSYPHQVLGYTMRHVEDPIHHVQGPVSDPTLPLVAEGNETVFPTSKKERQLLEQKRRVMSSIRAIVAKAHFN
jgi:hypothetical protein